MEWLLLILYVAFFSAIIYFSNFFRLQHISKHVVLLVFFAKLICSWSFYWLFVRFNFGGDSNDFVLNGKYLTDLFSTNRKVFFEILTGTGNPEELFPYYEQMPQWFSSDIFFNDNHTIIRINALLNFITYSYYRVNAVWFAFFSMTGCTGLYRLFSKIIKDQSPLIFIVVYLIPSVIFWTSGISKEAWLICVSGLFLLSLYQLYNNGFQLMHLLICLIACYLLIFIKIYFLLALIPALLSFVIAEKINRVNPLLIFTACYFTGLILLALVPGFNFIEYISRKQHDFISYTTLMQSKSFITIPLLEGRWLSFFKNAPVALWNVFTRPYLWELKSFFWLIPAIENILIIFMIIAGCSGFRFNRHQAAFSYACLFYSLSLYVIIGLTTPVIGSLLRYKAPLIPFLLMFFISHFHLNLFKSRWSFLRKS